MGIWDQVTREELENLLRAKFVDMNMRIQVTQPFVPGVSGPATGQQPARELEGPWGNKIWHVSISPQNNPSPDEVYEANVSVYGDRGNRLLLEQSGGGYNAYRGDILLSTQTKTGFQNVARGEAQTTGVESWLRRLRYSFQAYGEQVENWGRGHESVPDIMYRLRSEGLATRNVNFPTSTQYVAPTTSPEYLNYLQWSRNVMVVAPGGAGSRQIDEAKTRALQEIRSNPNAPAYQNLFGGTFYQEKGDQMVYVTPSAVGTVSTSPETGLPTLDTMVKDPLIKRKYAVGRRDIAENWVSVMNKEGQIVRYQQMAPEAGQAYRESSTLTYENDIPSPGYAVNRVLPLIPAPAPGGYGYARVPEKLIEQMRAQVGAGPEETVRHETAYRSFRSQPITGVESLADLFPQGKLALDLVPGTKLINKPFRANQPIRLGTFGANQIPIDISTSERAATIANLKMILPAAWMASEEQRTAAEPYLQMLRKTGYQPYFTGGAGEVRIGADIAQMTSGTEKQAAVKYGETLPFLGHELGFYQPVHGAKQREWRELPMPGNRPLEVMSETKSLSATLGNALEAMEPAQIQQFLGEMYNLQPDQVPLAGNKFVMQPFAQQVGFRSNELFLEDLKRRALGIDLTPEDKEVIRPLYQGGKPTAEFARQQRLVETYGIGRVSGWLKYGEYTPETRKFAEQEAVASMLEDERLKAQANYTPEQIAAGQIYKPSAAKARAALGNFIKFTPVEQYNTPSGRPRLLEAFMRTEAVVMPGLKRPVYEWEAMSERMDYNVMMALANQGLSGAQAWIRKNQYQNSEVRQALKSLQAIRQYNEGVMTAAGNRMPIAPPPTLAVPIGNQQTIKPADILARIEAWEHMESAEDPWLKGTAEEGRLIQLGSNKANVVRMLADWWANLQLPNPLAGQAGQPANLRVNPFTQGFYGTTTRMMMPSPMVPGALDVSEISAGEGGAEQTVTHAPGIYLDILKRFLQAEAAQGTPQEKFPDIIPALQRFAGWAGKLVDTNKDLLQDQPRMAIAGRTTGSLAVPGEEVKIPYDELLRQAEVMGMPAEMVPEWGRALSNSLGIYMRDPTPILGSTEYAGGLYPVQMKTAWINPKTNKWEGSDPLTVAMIQRAYQQRRSQGLYVGVEKGSQGDWDFDPFRLIPMAVPYEALGWRKGGKGRIQWGENPGQGWEPALQMVKGKPTGAQMRKWEIARYRGDPRSTLASAEGQENYVKFLREVLKRQASPEFQQRIQAIAMGGYREEGKPPETMANALDPSRGPWFALMRQALGMNTEGDNILLQRVQKDYAAFAEEGQRDVERRHYAAGTAYNVYNRWIPAAGNAIGMSEKMVGQIRDYMALPYQLGVDIKGQKTPLETLMGTVGFYAGREGATAAPETIGLNAMFGTKFMEKPILDISSQQSYKGMMALIGSALMGTPNLQLGATPGGQEEAEIQLARARAIAGLVMQVPERTFEPENAAASGAFEKDLEERQTRIAKEIVSMAQTAEKAPSGNQGLIYESGFGTMYEQGLIGPVSLAGEAFLTAATMKREWYPGSKRATEEQLQGFGKNFISPRTGQKVDINEMRDELVSTRLGYQFLTGKDVAAGEGMPEFMEPTQLAKMFLTQRGRKLYEPFYKAGEADTSKSLTSQIYRMLGAQLMLPHPSPHASKVVTPAGTTMNVPDLMALQQAAVATGEQARQALGTYFDPNRPFLGTYALASSSMGSLAAVGAGRPITEDYWRSSLIGGAAYGLSLVKPWTGEENAHPWTSHDLSQIFTRAEPFVLGMEPHGELGTRVEQLIAKTPGMEALGVHVGQMPTTPYSKLQIGQGTFFMSNLPDFMRMGANMPGTGWGITDIKNIPNVKGKTPAEIYERWKVKGNQDYLWQAASYMYGHGKTQLPAELREHYKKQGVPDAFLDTLTQNKGSYQWAVTSFESAKEAEAFFGGFSKEELDAYMQVALSGGAQPPTNVLSQEKFEQLGKAIRVVDMPEADLNKYMADLTTQVPLAMKGVVKEAPIAAEYFQALVQQALKRFSGDTSPLNPRQLEVIAQITGAGQFPGFQINPQTGVQTLLGLNTGFENVIQRWRLSQGLPYSGVSTAQINRNAQGQLNAQARGQTATPNIPIGAQGRFTPAAYGVLPMYPANMQPPATPGVPLAGLQGGGAVPPNQDYYPTGPVNPQTGQMTVTGGIAVQSLGGMILGGGGGGGGWGLPEDQWAQANNMFIGGAQTAAATIAKNMIFQFGGTPKLSPGRKRELWEMNKAFLIGGNLDETMADVELRAYQQGPDVLRRIFKGAGIQEGATFNEAMGALEGYGKRTGVNTWSIMRKRAPWLYKAMQEAPDIQRLAQMINSRISEADQITLSKGPEDDFVRSLIQGVMGGEGEFGTAISQMALWKGRLGFGSQPEVTRGQLFNLGRAGLYQASANLRRSAVGFQAATGAPMTAQEEIDKQYEQTMAKLDDEMASLQAKQAALQKNMGGIGGVISYMQQQEGMGVKLGGLPRSQQLRILGQEMSANLALFPGKFTSEAIGAWQAEHPGAPVTMADVQNIPQMANLLQEMGLNLQSREAVERARAEASRMAALAPYGAQIRRLGGELYEQQHYLARGLQEQNLLPTQRMEMEQLTQERIASLEERQARYQVMGTRAALTPEQQQAIQGMGDKELNDYIAGLEQGGATPENIKPFVDVQLAERKLQAASEKRQDVEKQREPLSKGVVEQLGIMDTKLQEAEKTGKKYNDMLANRKISEEALIKVSEQRAHQQADAELAERKALQLRTAEAVIGFKAPSYEAGMERVSQFMAETKGTTVEREQAARDVLRQQQQRVQAGEDAVALAARREEEARYTSPFGQFARRALGGFGLMYIRSMAGLIGGPMETGYQEMVQARQMYGTAAARAYGGEIPATSELAIQRILANQYGGGALQALNWQRAQLMQNQPGLYGMGESLVSGAAAFGATEWAASLIPGVSAAMALPWAIGAGAVAIGGITAAKISAAYNQPEQTGLDAAIRMARGEDLNHPFADITLWDQTKMQYALAKGKPQVGGLIAGNPRVAYVADTLSKMRELYQSQKPPTNFDEAAQRLGISQAEKPIFAQLYARMTSTVSAKAAGVSDQAWVQAQMFQLQYGGISEANVGKLATGLEFGFDYTAMARQMIGMGAGTAETLTRQGQVTNALLNMPQMQNEAYRQQVTAGMQFWSQLPTSWWDQLKAGQEEAAVTKATRFGMLTPAQQDLVKRQDALNALYKRYGITERFENLPERYLQPYRIEGTTAYAPRQTTPEQYQAQMTDLQRQEQYMGYYQQIQQRYATMGYTGPQIQGLMQPLGISQPSAVDLINIQRSNARGASAEDWRNIMTAMYPNTNAAWINRMQQTITGSGVNPNMQSMINQAVQGNAQALGWLQSQGVQVPGLLGAAGTNAIPWNLITTDVTMGGTFTGRPLFSTSMNIGNPFQGGLFAQTVAPTVFGANWRQSGAASAAVMGVNTGMIDPNTGQPFVAGGQLGLQWYQIQLQQQQAQAQIALQQRSQNLQYAFTTGLGLGGYGTVNPVTGQPFQLAAGGMWGLEDRSRQLGYRQQEYGFQQQEASLAMNQRFFQQNMAMNVQQARMQRGWTMQDWGYQDTTRGLQWQWRLEDFQEQSRFMTGRERRLAERQMGREALMFGLEGEQIDKTRERQKETWRLEDERFTLQRKQNSESVQFQKDQIAMQRQFYEERKRLETDQVEMQRAMWVENMKLQQESLNLQKKAQEDAKDIQQRMLEIQTAQLLYTTNAENILKLSTTTSQNAEVVFDKAMEFFQFVADLFGISVVTGGAQGAPTGSTGGAGGGGGGPAARSQASGGLQVGELGPEIFYPKSGGYVVPSFLNTWNDTVVNKPHVEKAKAQPMHVSLYIGDKHLGDYIIDTVEKELRI